MALKPEFVQIEAGEEVVSVKDRLSFYRGCRVLLVWPEEGTALRRKLDLVLIQREAMRRAIRLALVTHDPEVISNAAELNISTFETIGASERARWKRGRSKVFTSRYQRPQDNPEPDDLMEVASRVRVERRMAPASLRLALRVGILAALAGIVLVVAYVVIPGATVTLALAEQVIEVNVTITADPELRTRQVDVESATVPTVILRADVTDTASISTSGRAPSDAALARGTVTFTNLTNNAVTLPLNTQVSTGTGDAILFRTTQEAVLPAGSSESVSVPVEAMPASAGEAGNVPAGTINTVIGPLEASVSVTNTEATFGGESREVFVVSEADRQSLLRQMNAQLQFRASTDMEAQLGPTQFIIPQTIRLVPQSEITTFSAEVGDRAEALTLTMRAQVEAIGVDEQRAQEVVFARMSAQIPRGRVIDPSSIAYTRGPASVDPATGRVTFVMSGSVRVTGRVDAGQLQARLAGRPVDEALVYLAREVDLAEGAAPVISLSPDWLNRLPVLPLRIAVRTGEPAAAASPETTPVPEADS